MTIWKKVGPKLENPQNFETHGQNFFELWKTSTSIREFATGDGPKYVRDLGEVRSF